MGWLRKRFSEGSSMAGAGLAIDPIARLLLSGGRDPLAWGALAAAVAAIVIPEGERR